MSSNSPFGEGNPDFENDPNLIVIIFLQKGRKNSPDILKDCKSLNLSCGWTSQLRSFEEGTIITPIKKGCISIVIGENIGHLIALGRLDSLIL
jgi:hypothetical protein